VSDNAPARPFLELIEATLNRQGKTKAWLAQRSKVNRNTINNWGIQPRTPQAGNVLAVADALGIEQDQALRLAGLRTDMPRAERDVPAITEASDEELLAELHRRLKNR
jgi:lambda repressor-like predicted transcriptional regulator